MSKSFASLLVAMVTLLVTLTACSDDPTPTPAPTGTPTDTPTPIATAVSFEEYLSICQESRGDDETLDEDATNGDLSAMFAETLAEMESVTPPAEVAEWHDDLLSTFRNVIGIIDLLPADETVDFDTVLLIAVTIQADTEEAEADLSADVRTRLEEEGCIQGDSNGGSERFDEPETVVGTFTAGESVRVGDYLVEVTDAYFDDEGVGISISIGAQDQDESDQDELGLTVKAAIASAVGSAVAEPDCVINMTLEDQSGMRYERSVCSWSGTVDDEILPDTTIGYSISYVDVPVDSAGLTWRFSDGTTGVAFDLTGLLSTSLETDREALVALYDATDGQNWTNSTNWLSDAPLGEWHGVRTDFFSDRVIGLYLHENQLSGAIPSELGNLTNLKDLFLYSNQLSGEIPPELGNLVNLERLFVSDNRLSGCVPEGLRDQLGNHDLDDLGLSDCGEAPDKAVSTPPTPTSTSVFLPTATPRPAATPVPTASDRADITLTYLCAWEGSRSCEDMQEFFEAVQSRTGGQVNFELSHFAEFGGIQEQTILMDVLQSGELDFGEALSGDFFSYPNALNLWEAFANPDDYSEVSDALAAEVIRLVGLEAEGLDLRVVGMNLFSDLYLFSRQPVSSLADLGELRTGLAFNSLTYPVLESLLLLWGSEIILTGFPGLYSGLADGDLDAAFTCARCAANADWDQVTGHITGPIVGLRPQTFMVFGGSAWDSLPTDIQAIIEEESAAHTRRELAKAVSRESEALQTLTSRGMSYTELPPEVLAQVRDLVAEFSDVDEESARALGLR